MSRCICLMNCNSIVLIKMLLINFETIHCLIFTCFVLVSMTIYKVLKTRVIYEGQSKITESCHISQKL